MKLRRLNSSFRHRKIEKRQRSCRNRKDFSLLPDKYSSTRGIDGQGVFCTVGKPHSRVVRSTSTIQSQMVAEDLASAWSGDSYVLFQSGVRERYTESGAPITHSSSIRKTGARGGSRTHMRKNPRRILSPQRLPFRHPGTGSTNLAERNTYCNTIASIPVTY